MVEFELSFTQANNLLACIRKETLLAKQLSAHETANGKILIPGPRIRCRIAGTVVATG